MPVLRASRASRAIIRTPPARQASRRQPGGTSCASAQSASAQSRRSAGSSRAQARPSQLIAPRARPRPARLAASRPEPALAARSGCCAAWAASARVALASPSAVSRYRCRRGRPGCGSSCQQASTSPRSASRIRIGYRVPDFRPVVVASAYPCCHCEG